MASFSYQNHCPFLLDSEVPLLPSELGEMSSASSYFNCYYPSGAVPEAVDSSNYETSSSLRQMSYSSVVVHPQGSEGVAQVPQDSLQKKRKDRDEACLRSVLSKSKESKNRKQKKLNDGLKEAEEKKPKDSEKKEAKACVEPPTGYIHVRARRGQATDSHSLAERVRREKIRDRMKMLQGLVPGCDKVTGKALMLDEIINYVQSLQNQVELASVNPMLYDFALDFDGVHMNHLEKLEGMSQPMPSVNTNHIQSTAFQDKTNCLRAMETSVPILLHGQGPIAFSQDSSSALAQVGDQRQGLLQQVVFKNMCSFQ